MFRPARSLLCAAVGCIAGMNLSGFALQVAPPATRPAPAIRSAGPQAQKSASAKPRVFAPIKLGPPKAGARIPNLKAFEAQASILASLKLQRQAADLEFAQMKVPRTTSITRPSQANPGAVGGLNRSATAPARLVTQRGAPNNISAGKVLSGPGSGPAGHLVRSDFDNTIVSCTYNPTTRVLKVSGTAATFTPDARFNLFSISGCSFGPSGSGNRVYIYGPNGFHEDLVIDFWSDNGIAVHFDPALAGVLDQKSVSLVVAPGGRQPVEAHGYSFMAARGLPAPDGTPQDVLLKNIPQSSVTLGSPPLFLVGYNTIPPQMPGQFALQGGYQDTSAWVFRYFFAHYDSIGGSAACFINDKGYSDSNFCHASIDPAPSPSQDTYDFSRLAPGFAVTSLLPFTDNVDPSALCGSASPQAYFSSGASGPWDFRFAGPAKVAGTTPTSWCWTDEALYFALIPTDRTSMLAQSSYGISVWVMGPRCVDPWTALPDQACIASVRKQYGE